MTRLILHVGMDKTGTTAIQFALQQMREALLSSHRVLVPKTGQWRDFSHHPFAFASFQTVGFTHADLTRLFDELQDEIVATGAETVLISSECLFKLPYGRPDSPFFDHLGRVFDGIGVLAYVRRQDHWVESRYRHSVISGKEMPLEQLVRPNYCDYKRFVDLWAGRVGAENVTVRPYERSQFTGGDIVSDFLSAAGIARPEGVFGAVAEKNSAFHYKDVLFRAAVNDLGLPAEQNHALNEWLLARDHSGDPDRRFLSATRAAELIKRYRAVNAGLAKAYAGRADGRLFLDPPPVADDAPPVGPVLPAAEAQATLEDLARAQPPVALAIRDRLAGAALSADASETRARRRQELASAAAAVDWTLALPADPAGEEAPLPPAASGAAPAPRPAPRDPLVPPPFARRWTHAAERRLRQISRRPATPGKPLLFLHVGTGKTGTTSIQTFCWTNRRQFDRLGLTYPRLGVLAGAHHRLSPHVPGFLSEWDFIPPKTWAPWLAARAYQPLLLSSELMASARPAIVQSLSEVLTHYFDVRIVMYVRRIDDSIMASFNQTVKAGTQRRPIETALPTLFEKLRIDHVLDSWASAFGRDNIILRPYDRGRFVNGDILQDFCAAIGLPWSDGFRIPSTNPNPRLNRAALEFKRCLNMLVPDTEISAAFNPALLDYSAGLDPRTRAIFYESDLLPGAVRRMLIDRQASAYRDIARNYSDRPDTPLFSADLPPDDLDWTPLSLPDASFAELGRTVLDGRLRGILKQQIKAAETAGDPQRLLYAGRFHALL